VSLQWEQDVKRTSYLRSLFLEVDLDLGRAKDLVDIDEEDEDEEKQELYRRLLLGSMETEKTYTKKDRHPGKEKGQQAKKRRKEVDVEADGSGFVFDQEDPRFKSIASREEFAVDAMEPNRDTSAFSLMDVAEALALRVLCKRGARRAASKGLFIPDEAVSSLP
jgi:hypothetical protein